MPCRCGHGRGYHRPTANAVAKKRARRDRRPAQAGCRYGVRYDGLKVCPCRAYVEAPMAHA